MANAISSPSALLTVHASSTQIQILSLARLATGLGAFFAPAFFTQKFYGFTQRTHAGASATASTTTPKAGSPEETTLAIRLFGARDIAIGLLLRDSASAVVERAVQIGFISSGLDILAAGLGFIEGNLSREIATAVATAAGVVGAFQAWILYR